MSQVTQLYVVETLKNWLVCSVYVFLSYLVLYKFRFLKIGRIIDPDVKSRDLIRDYFLTSLSCLIQGAMGVTIYLMWAYEYGHFYRNISDMGVPYFIFSIYVLFVGYDAYFYWSHWLLHNTKIGRNIHKTHHLTHNPTPMSALGIHPFEAFILTLYAGIVPFIFPVHMWALTVFLLFSFLFSIYIHSGVEIIPEKWRRSNPFWSRINSASRHTNHHMNPKEDIGLYFLFWDRYMKTIGKEAWEQESAAKPTNQLGSLDLLKKKSS